MNGPAEELITRREVTAMFGVTSATVAQWARRSLLPEVRSEDGKPRYRRADAAELHRSGQQAGRGPGAPDRRGGGHRPGPGAAGRAAAEAEAEVLTASGARVNRRDPGVRVHLTVRLPGGEDQ